MTSDPIVDEAVPTAPASGAARAGVGITVALAVGAGLIGLAWDRNVPASFTGVTSAASTPYAGISAGTTHSCGMTKSDGLRCWGANADWQLGNGVRTWSRVPVKVIGLDRDVAAVTVGGSHSCALTAARAVLCWSQEAAAIANPVATSGSARPVPVAGLPSGVVSISAGNGHTCALTEAGAVSCWGVFNRANASRATVAVPTTVRGLESGVKAMDVGFDNQCAITSDDAVRCWGQDYETNARGTVLAPEEVSPAGTDAVAVSVGGVEGCLVTAAGGVRCWSHPGQEGAAEPGEEATLTDVPELADVTSLTAGYKHACAVTRDGSAVCWGRNEHGELGDGTTKDAEAPVQVVGLRVGTAAVSAGFQHTCALLRDRQTLCWGYNFEGQLGNGASTVSFTSVPLRVAPTSTATPAPQSDPRASASPTP
jgi:hypothetical protein